MPPAGNWPTRPGSAIGISDGALLPSALPTEICHVMKDSVRNADEYIATKPEWAELLEKLRSVMLACGLEETIKWGIPTYLTDGRQVAGLAAFKHHVAIWFWHGALLEDPDQVLVNAQEGKTQGLRQWRFTQLREVKVGLVRKYIKAAVANARAGKV